MNTDKKNEIKMLELVYLVRKDKINAYLRNISKDIQKMDFMLIASKGNQRTLCARYYELLLIGGLNPSKFLRNF
jgi:hypothetical protein